MDEDDDFILRFGTDDYTVELAGWRAVLVIAVLGGMPWVVGLITIIRTAMHGW